MPKQDQTLESTSRIQTKMSELIDQLRSDIRRLDDPQAKAMFETSAEVLIGLKKAFEDFSRKNEEAWEK